MTSSQDNWARDRWLLRFPWDWPDVAWDIAKALVDHWEGGRTNQNLGDAHGTSDITQLEEALALYPCEPGQVRDEVIQAVGANWSDELPAVAAFLRGNVKWAEVLGLTSADASEVEKQVSQNRLRRELSVEQEILATLTLESIGRQMQAAVLEQGWEEFFRLTREAEIAGGNRIELQASHGSVLNQDLVRELVIRKRQARTDSWDAIAREYRQAYDFLPSMSLALALGELLLLEADLPD